MIFFGQFLCNNVVRDVVRGVVKDVVYSGTVVRV